MCRSEAICTDGTRAPMWEFAAKVHYHIEMIHTADLAGWRIPRVSALTLQH